MTPERLRELRCLVSRIHPANLVGDRDRHAALALIDAELAKPEVCVWSADGDGDGLFYWQAACGHRDRGKYDECPDCGKRVEVA